MTARAGGMITLFLFKSHVWLAGLLAAIVAQAALFSVALSQERQRADLLGPAALGKAIFFDATLSNPSGQACASCHAAQGFFVDPDAQLPTSEGATAGHFGNRNTPTAMYMAFSPAFHFDEEEGIYVGGQFIDGRASSLEEQAEGPMLNPIEMGNTSKAMVIAKVQAASYAANFERLYGADIFEHTERAYSKLAEAIAAFERTDEFSPFTSKYDMYLAGRVDLTEQEQRGLELFEREDKGNCAACHPSRPGAGGEPPLFTDFTYDNLGAPANKANRFYGMSAEFNPAGSAYVDKGLADNPQVQRDGRADTEKGKFRVPTLRNVARTGPWGHNGYFQTLAGVVEFYNSRDTRGVCADSVVAEIEAHAHNCWPAPEIAQNVNADELGDLGLEQREVEDIVAFLQTLTDGYDQGRVARNELP